MSKKKEVETEEIYDFNLDFSDGDTTVTVVIAKEDMPKVARAFYEWCIDNKIKANIIGE